MLKIINKDHFANNRIFYGFLLIAFIIRVVGIDYGYPYIFNIDEPAIVRSALGLRYSGEIGHFDWPHFTFYFNFIFYFLFIKLRGLIQIIGARELLENTFPILWNDPFVFYFITRFLNALLGALTLVPIYLTAKEMFSKRIGLISVALFSVIPYHVNISHVAVPEPLLVFLLAWTIYFSHRFSKSLKYKDIAAAAVMFGLASGVKYNAIILSPILVLFVLYRLKISNSINLKVLMNLLPKFIFFGFISLLTLLSTTPEIITDWNIFWSYEYSRGFLWQLKINSGPISPAEYPAAVIEKIYMIFTNMGFVVLPLFGYSVYRTFKKDISDNERILIRIMAVVALVFVMFTSRYSHANSHYFLPVYSLIVIGAAWGLNKLINLAKSRLVLLLTLVLLLSLSLYNTFIFLRDDTRNLALEYYEDARKQDGRTYISGQDMYEADYINNLNIKRVKENPEIGVNDVVISQTVIENNDKIMLIETIGNFFRRGPIIYVYKQAI